MTQTLSERKPAPAECQCTGIKAFVREEDGVMTIFTICLMLMMLMVAGIGVDLMQNEMRRTSLQNTMDRAVLAAADLDQTLPAEDVVRDYFDKAGLGDYLTSVQPNLQLNMRNVQATAFTESPTQFMRLLGVDSLPVPAASSALEELPNVEISLVLDVSGSMRFNSRMDNLRPAARNFVDIVLAGAAVNTTSINLIPYAGQTNPGPFMFSRLNGVRVAPRALDFDDGGILEAASNSRLPPNEPAGTGPVSGGRYVYPNISSCLELSAGDFNNVGLPDDTFYEQTAHFLHSYLATETIRDEDGNEILFDENDEPTTDGTGQPHSVMNWGWCPYDTNAIIYASNNPTVLKNRINTMRMYDGTGTQYAMKWAAALLSPDSQPDFAAMALPANDLVPPLFANRPLPYDQPDTTKYIVLMTDGQITEQPRPKDSLREENPTEHMMSQPFNRRKTISNSNTNFTRFKDICDLAKDPSRNIVIYTIAFEAPVTAENQMRNCASSTSHFFRATGKEQINAAFSTIARQINKLRLTQ